MIGMRTSIDVGLVKREQPAAVLEVALQDVSRDDTPAETIARARDTSPRSPPIAFTNAYDPARSSGDTFART
jgi:uncharacterized lipoprotein YbaY